jgi:hypothetical protein
MALAEAFRRQASSTSNGSMQQTKLIGNRRTAPAPLGRNLMLGQMLRAHQHSDSP